MRIPIQNALTYPEKAAAPSPDTDLTAEALTFTRPDPRKYPMLSLAFRAAESGLSATITYNAANEIAVAAFLGHRLPFLSIARLTEAVLNKPLPPAPASLEEGSTDRRRLRPHRRRTTARIKSVLTEFIWARAPAERRAFRCNSPPPFTFTKAKLPLCPAPPLRRQLISASIPRASVVYKQPPDNAVGRKRGDSRRAHHQQ